MTQQPLPLVRTDYIKRPEDPPTLHSESKTDMESYVRQLEIIHNTGLHGWGVAGGLQVTATAGGTTVTVKPGIALQGGPAKQIAGSLEEAEEVEEVAAEDLGGGRQLSLAANGFAQIISSDGKPRRVPVTEEGVTLDTPQLSGEKYLTIQFGEYLNEDNCDFHGICRIYHAPLLSFQDVDVFADDGSSLILARMSLDADGKVRSLTAGPRRSLDLPTGSLHFWRGQATLTSPFTVENVPAGEMIVRDDGGLNLTVAHPTDQISLTAPQQGNFARLTLATEETIATGKVTVEDSLEVTGTTSLQDTTITNATVSESLDVTGTTSLHGTTITGNLEVINAQNQPLLSVQNSGVGIGTPKPRTALDMGAGVFSGAASDYLKAQLAMSGGGKVTWGGSGGRLKWTASFIAPLTRSAPGAFGSGFVELAQPHTDIPAKDVYNGTSRSANSDGIILTEKEALYGEHKIGGQSTEITYKIVSLDSTMFIPGNWLLVAAVSGNDNTVKLGTGSIVSARSSLSHGGSLPSGTILMWSGNINNIPDGWELCTGEGGRTPDLRGRFLVGAGPGYDEPGKYDEATQHTHTVSLSDTLGTGVSGKHDHQTSTTWYTTAKAAREVVGAYTFHAVDSGGADAKNSRTSENGSHSHTLPGVTIQSSNASSAVRPRWYALCFIMKR